MHTNNFLTILYREDPDLANSLEKELLDIWLAEAINQGYSWQSIEKLSQIARDRELFLQGEEDTRHDKLRL